MENSPKSSNLWKSSAWSFGTLVKSLTSKSEEVLQAYQRDLQEFGLGLKRETAVAAELTAHVVKDLPGSLENTAAVAQESLEAVGQTIEDFSSSVWRGTSEFIGQVKEAVKKVDDEAAATSEPTEPARISGRYSRFEAQLNALQCDSTTYCDEPEDHEDYSAWRSSFDMDSRKDEISTLLEEHPVVQELHGRMVPSSIEDNVFWTRYFYRLHKLQQAEDARADLVKRATTGEEEDLSWEDEDDELKDVPLNSTEVKPAIGESAAEDEAGSDNSTGSEWLVVQEERETERTPTPESRQTVPSVKKGDEKEEDWGEWE